MMVYPTRRAVLLVALGVPLALALGVVAPRLWLAGLTWAGLALGILLVDWVVAGTRTSLQIAYDLPRAIAIGQRPQVAFALSFAGTYAPNAAETTLDVGPKLHVSPLRQRLPVQSRTATADFALVPLRRGEGRFERLWTRWQGPFGLVWLQRGLEIGRSVPILPNVQAVKEEAIQLFRRDAPSGLHLQLNAGQSTEFHALKEFQTGMDRRTIDWKQSAKHGLLRAKEFQAEQNQHVVLVLDTGRLMCEPLNGLPRLDRAIQAILLIGFVALKLGDRVGLFAFDEKPRLKSGTVAGAAAFPLLQHLAAQLDYSTAETNFTLGLTQLAGELEHRSVVVIFTDFVDATSAELMLENIGRLLKRHLVLFLVFRDEELETLVRAEPLSPEDVSRAVIADAMLRDRDIVLERLRRLGVEVVFAPTEGIGMKVLEAYLAAKRTGRA